MMEGQNDGMKTEYPLNYVCGGGGGGINIMYGLVRMLCRQVVGIPMGTDCDPLVADIFLFCYERDFMMSLSGDNQAGIIDAFSTSSRYFDAILK